MVTKDTAPASLMCIQLCGHELKEPGAAPLGWRHDRALFTTFTSVYWTSLTFPSLKVTFMSL